MIGDIMEQLSPTRKDYQSRTRTNVIRLFYWNGVWGMATALMAFGPGFLWHKALLPTLLAVGLDVAAGVGMILANKKYIMQLDELQRRVQLNSFAITVGVAVIVGIPYSVMSMYHVIPFRADIGHLVG